MFHIPIKQNSTVKIPIPNEIQMFKYQKIIYEYPLLNFARYRPAEFMDIGLVGPYILDDSAVEKDQHPIGIHQNFIEFR